MEVSRREESRQTELRNRETLTETTMYYQGASSLPFSSLPTRPASSGHLPRAVCHRPALHQGLAELDHLPIRQVRLLLWLAPIG